MPSESKSGPPGKPAKRSVVPDSAKLRLDQLRRGQIRALRLRLMEIRGRQKDPTDFFLDVKVACDQPERLYYFDVKADFGAFPPRTARLRVLKNRYEATLPVTLVEHGATIEKGVSLEIDAATDKVVLWVTTEGPSVVPPKLAAEIRVRDVPETALAEELDTIRLPSVKALVKQSLVGALRAAPTRQLVALGEILVAEDVDDKMRWLGRLVEMGGDVRLIEAGVRDIELAEQTVAGFPRIDFPTLMLNDPVQAAVAIFHPETPPYLVNLGFVIAFERHLDPAGAESAALWKQLAKAAAVILCAKSRELLDEDIEAMGFGPDRTRQTLLRMLVDWAVRRSEPPPPPPLNAPIEHYLNTIAAEDGAAALQATVQLLANYGFVGLSMRLD
jgi:hypothetical protein